MTRIRLDSASVAKLAAVKECAQLCDEKGRALGQFIPVASRDLYKQVDVPFTDEELDEFEKQPGGRPLPEILADLQKRSGK